MSRTDLSIWTAAAALACFGPTALATAQNLRHGAQSARIVIVAKVVSTRPLGDKVILHGLETVRTLRGDAPARLTIVEPTKVSDQPTPAVPRSPDDVHRIYCLNPATDTELPDSFGPYYRMTGFHGDNPVVRLDGETVDSNLRLVDILMRSERGALAPRACCAELVQLALGGEGTARTEAVQVLRERPITSKTLVSVEKSSLLARAVGEGEDIALKCALASLCAEIEMPEVIDALCLSLENQQNETFARTVGRLARFRHGEDAVDVLRPKIVAARTQKTRDALLLALGATETERALEALLRYRRVQGDSEAIEAALRAHGTRRALDAVAKKPESRPASRPEKR